MIYDNITDMALEWGDGSDNPSGIAEIAFFIPLTWMKTIAKPAASTTAGSVVSIIGNHIMNFEKAPIRVIPMFDKSGINWKLAGEKGSKIFDQGVEVFVPNVSVKSLGTAAALKNYRGILIVGKADDSGQFWQVGSELFAATVTEIAGGTGVGATGEVGSKITLQAYGSAPVYSYEGDIPPVGAG